MIGGTGTEKDSGNGFTFEGREYTFDPATKTYNPRRETLKEQKIAIFADIPSLKVNNWTPSGLVESLERVASSNYDHFSPKELRLRAIAMLTGESPYGARIGVVQDIVAMALYSPDQFAQFAKDVSDGLDKKISAQTTGPETLENQSVLEKVEMKKSIAAVRAYESLAQVISEMGKDFGKLSPEDILRLSEVDHIFSGKWNGSQGRNLTFTDEKVRGYGIKLQQIVAAIWYDGFGEAPTPLKQEDLMPTMYGSTR